MTSTEFFNIELDYDLYSWRQLSEIAKVDDKTVRTWFKQKKLVKKPHKPYRKTLDNNNEIANLTAQGYSSHQIAELLGLTTRQVTVAKGTRKLKTNKFDKVTLTGIEEQVVIGSILGDGCIEIQNRHRNYHRLTIKHGEKQRAYIMFKQRLLSRIGDRVTKKLRIDNRPKFKDSIALSFHTHVNPLFSDYRANWYNPKKIIYEKDLYKLNGLGLAIWYMDDGFYHFGYHLSTDCFSREDLIKVQKMFKDKFGIATSIQGKNRMRILSESNSKYEALILPFIIPTMTYKVRLKSLELLETPEAGNQQPNLMNDIEVVREVQRLMREESTNKRNTSEGQLVIIDDIV